MIRISLVFFLIFFNSKAVFAENCSLKRGIFKAKSEFIHIIPVFNQDQKIVRYEINTLSDVTKEVQTVRWYATAEGLNTEESSRFIFSCDEKGIVTVFNLDKETPQPGFFLLWKDTIYFSKNYRDLYEDHVRESNKDLVMAESINNSAGLLPFRDTFKVEINGVPLNAVKKPMRQYPVPKVDCVPILSKWIPFDAKARKESIQLKILQTENTYFITLFYGQGMRSFNVWSSSWEEAVERGVYCSCDSEGTLVALDLSKIPPKPFFYVQTQE